MISEQVKRLRKLANQWKHNDVAGCNLIFEACDTIEALSAKARAADRPTEWIPVSERLPRNNGWYLVTIRGYETVTDVSLYSADGSAWSDVSTKQKVIAWMPLPEAYKGGDDSE